MDDFRYPIGKFQNRNKISAEQRADWVKQIAEAPTELRVAIHGLSSEQLDTPYRTGGWTVRQVVHHLPDSHMNSYIRFKLALTEDKPIIKPYQEERWAELNDYRDTPIEVSLILLETLHHRWVTLLSNLQDEQCVRTFTNPESGDVLSLETALGLYAWHGRHHVAQIRSLRKRMGW
ncbi:YfiT family bacillithiol transferase [Alicyclobacillus sp. ALC3]|uniref:YfiT family bacillithiol transferase n=1 Tax=Alicyclobacillus sp. ALC3 TaxID=2796143 RepID=UPI002378555E|nr:bacillithiol transferase BstA [Alicyclobacillus sp. ALC3]WDL98385.1 bacillithiol transferase BstA [Alicyclobacillus sp. ALC3]